MHNQIGENSQRHSHRLYIVVFCGIQFDLFESLKLHLIVKRLSHFETGYI